MKKNNLILLSINNLLEQIDIGVYIFVTMLLNDILFAEGHQIFAENFYFISLCLSLLFKPVGNLLFFRIGDKFGRGTANFISFAIIVGSFFIIANIQDKQSRAISILVIICRIMHGLAAMGEGGVMSKIYIAENTKNRFRQIKILGMEGLGKFGNMIGLLVVIIFCNYVNYWQGVYLFGTIIAVCGAVIGVKQRKFRGFVDAKHRVQSSMKVVGYNPKDLLKNNPIWQDKVSFKSIFCTFILEASGEVTFFIIHIYCNYLMRYKMGISVGEVLEQGLYIMIFEMIGYGLLAYIMFYHSPLVILRTKAMIFACCAILMPYAISNIESKMGVLMIQLILGTLLFSPSGVYGTLYKYFPVFKRFRYTSFIFSVAKVFVIVVGSSIPVFLDGQWEYICISIMMLSIAVAVIYAINHFEFLENSDSAYPDVKRWGS